MSWRFYATDTLTGELVADELPLSGVSMTRPLSGPWAMTGTLGAALPQFRKTDGSPILDEWRHAVWGELDGRIRGGGILTKSSLGPTAWDLTCDGYVRYAAGIPYLGTKSWTSVDALDVVRHVWAHVQSYPDGNIGLEVNDRMSGVLLGTADEPYALSWWDFPDCGDTINTLAKSTPFDYVEDHDSDGTGTIRHRLTLGDPNLGRTRDDIEFVQGENLALGVDIQRDGDEFANYIVPLGSGEGKARLYPGVVGTADGRLRRPYVLDRSDVSNTAVLLGLAQFELAQRLVLGSIEQITVRQHPNALLGSWQLGDTVRLRLHRGWFAGDLWVRILSETIAPETVATSMVLKVQRVEGPS